MGDGEQASFKKSAATKRPDVPDFIKLGTMQKVRERGEQGRSDLADHVNKHGVSNTRDILRSAKTLQMEIPDSMRSETGQDIIRSVDPSQLLPDSLRLYPKDQWTSTLRRISDAFAQAKAPETSVQNYDKYLHRLYPNSLSSNLSKEFVRRKIVDIKEVTALKEAFGCFRDEEWRALDRQGLTGRVDIVSDPQLQTDTFGYALCCGEGRVNDQWQIKSLLDEKYMRVSDSPVMPGDRMMVYSSTQKAYVGAGFVEECNWDTWEPTRVSYLARDSGCIHECHPRDFHQTATDGRDVQYYRRKDIRDDLIVLGTNVKDMKDAKLIIWGDRHDDIAGKVLHLRINQTYLKNGDTNIIEGTEREDRTVDLGAGKRIVYGTWDRAELQEKFKEAVRQQLRIKKDMASSQISAADQLVKLGKEDYSRSQWTSLPQMVEVMHGILSEHTEKSSALGKELQSRREDFDTSSLERSKGLAATIKGRTAQSPNNRISVLVGEAHILIEQERKALNLDKYPHVVFISRYPIRYGAAGREYDRKVLSKKSETTDATESSQ